MSDALTTVVKLTDPTDSSDVQPRDVIESSATLTQEAWGRAIARQGFVIVRCDRPDPVFTIDLEVGVLVEREVSGSLRSGFVVCWAAIVDDLRMSNYCGAPTASSTPLVGLERVAGNRFVVMAAGGIQTVEVDGRHVELTEVIDPDTGGVTRYGTMTADPGVSHEALGFDAAGSVVATADSVADEGGGDR
jgi:hypothetical protein